MSTTIYKLPASYPDHKDDEDEYDTMLELTNGRALFSVSKVKHGFLVQEECDQHFRVTISPAYLRALGEELIALSKT